MFLKVQDHQEAPRDNPETTRHTLMGRRGFPDPRQRPPTRKTRFRTPLSMSDVSKLQVFCGQRRANDTSSEGWLGSAPPTLLVSKDPGRAEHKLLPWPAKTSLASSCLLSTDREGALKR